MQFRQLGELTVSEIGYGAMGLSGVYGAANDAESVKLLQQAYDLGINFFDTADVYGAGHNEQLLGKAFARKRDRVILASKTALTWKAGNPEDMMVSNKPDYIQQAIEKTLTRLNTDYLDLYYLHRIDPNTPIEESVAAMAELVKAGKVRFIGLSEASAQTIAKAHKVHRITAVQSEYSLWSRDVENNGVMKTLNDLEIGFVPYSPLGRGFLASSLQAIHKLDALDHRNKMPRWQGDNLQQNLLLLEKFNVIAKEKGIAPAQLALAWVLAQGDNIVPIPGTRNSDRLKQNISASDIVLTSDENQTLGRLFTGENVRGERYPKTLMKTIDQ